MKDNLFSEELNLKFDNILKIYSLEKNYQNNLMLKQNNLNDKHNKKGYTFQFAEEIDGLNACFDSNINKINKSTNKNNLLNYVKPLIKSSVDIIGNTNFGINLKAYDEEGRNILHKACLNLKFDIVNDLITQINKYFIEKTKKLNKKDKFGNTPLLLACKQPTKVIDTSIDQINNEITTNNSNKIFENSNYNNENRYKILNILVDNGALFNIVQPCNLWSTFHWLSFNKDSVSIKSFLTNYNFLVLCPNKQGYFPIDFSGLKDDVKSVEIYVQNILATYKELKMSIDEQLNIINKQYNIKDKKVLNKLNKNLNDKSNKLNQNINKSLFRSLKYSNNKNDYAIDELDGCLEENLKILYLYIYLHHCLYWTCRLNLNYTYINQLLEYNLDPSLNLHIHNNENCFHAASRSGNSKAFLLMNVYYKTNFIAEPVIDSFNKNNNNKLNTNLNKYSMKNLKAVSLFVTMGDSLVTNKAKESNNYDFQKRLSIIKVQPEYYLLNKTFKIYLKQILFYIFGIKSIKSNVDICSIRDYSGNNLFHIACNFGKFDYLNYIIETINIINPSKYLKQQNKELISAYAYIKDKKLIYEVKKYNRFNYIEKLKNNQLNSNDFKNTDFDNKLLIENTKNRYSCANPLVVLVCKKEKSIFGTLNTIIKVGKSEGLIIYVIENIEKNKIYIALDIPEDVFRREADNQKLQVKGLEYNSLKQFENTKEFANSVEPFFTRHYQEVIFFKLYEIFDLRVLKAENILLKIYFMHKPTLQNKIYTSWFMWKKWYKPKLITNFFLKFLVFEKKEINYNEITTIYRYLGGKLAIYYAFSCFVVNYLIPLVIVSIVMICLYRERLFYTNIVFPTYSFLVILWSMIFIEKWTRKNKEIIQKWGINSYKNTSKVRESFVGDEFYNDLKTKLAKHDYSNRKLVIVILSLPIQIGIILSIIVVFYVTKKFQDQYNSTLFLKYIPQFINSLYILLINLFYNRIAYIFTELENHKYDDTYEYSLILKLFSFRLVSELTGVFYLIFTRYNVEELKTLLYTLLSLKCFSPILYRYFYAYFTFKYYRTKYFSAVNKELDAQNTNEKNTLNERNNINRNKITINEIDRIKGNNILKKLQTTKSFKFDILNPTDNKIPEQEEFKLQSKRDSNRELLNTINNNINSDLDRNNTLISKKLTKNMKEKAYSNKNIKILSKEDLIKVPPSSLYACTKKLNAILNIKEKDLKTNFNINKDIFNKVNTSNNQSFSENNNSLSKNTLSHKDSNDIKCSNDKNLNNEIKNNKSKLENNYDINKPNSNKNTKLNLKDIYNNRKVRILDPKSTYMKNKRDFQNINIDSKHKLFNPTININPDNIELNNRLLQRENVLYYYADIILILVIMILFSSIIPFAPIIFIISQTICHHLFLYADIYYKGLGYSTSSYNIGLWEKIFDFAITISIIFNCFMLYFFDLNQFNEHYDIINGANLTKVNNEVDFGNYESGLFKLLLIEHAFLLLRKIFKLLITKTPSWVNLEINIIDSIDRNTLKEKEDIQNLKHMNEINNIKTTLKKELEYKESKIISLESKVNDYNTSIKDLQEQLNSTQATILKFNQFKNIVCEKALNLKKSIFDINPNYKNNIYAEEEFNVELKYLINTEKNKLSLKKLPSVNTSIHQSKKNINMQKRDKQEFPSCITTTNNTNISKLRNNSLNPIYTNNRSFKTKKLEDNTKNKLKINNKKLILNDNTNTSKLKLYLNKDNTENLNDNLSSFGYSELPISLENNSYFKNLDKSKKMLIETNELNKINKYALVKKSVNAEQLFLNTIEKESNKINSVYENKYDNLLNIVFNELITSKKVYLDKEKDNLITSFGKVYIISLLKTTFDKIEYEIFNLKFYKIYSNSSEVVILCTNCGNDVANFLCKICVDELLCIKCKNSHSKTKVFLSHTSFEKLSDYKSYEKFNKFSKYSLIEEIYNFRRKYLKNKEAILNSNNKNLNNNFIEKNYIDNVNQNILIKSELYSFPINDKSINYNNLKIVVSYLYNCYINKNGIKEKKIQLKDYLINRYLKFEESIDNTILWANQKSSKIISEFNYSPEELFYINRIAFLNFKNTGVYTNLQVIYSMLYDLQTSTFEVKLRILLRLLDVYDNGIIFKSEIVKLVCISAVYPSYISKDIVNIMFKTDDYIKVDNLITLISNDNKLKELFKTILQSN